MPVFVKAGPNVVYAGKQWKNGQSLKGKSIAVKHVTKKVGQYAVCVESQ